MLAYFDLRQLLDQGFEIGLAQVPAFNTFADEFRSLDALGLAVHSDGDLLETDARLVDRRTVGLGLSSLPRQ